jgi:hypothetical protein
MSSARCVDRRPDPFARGAFAEHPGRGQQRRDTSKTAATLTRCWRRSPSAKHTHALRDFPVERRRAGSAGGRRPVRAQARAGLTVRTCWWMRTARRKMGKAVEQPDEGGRLQAHQVPPVSISAILACSTNVTIANWLFSTAAIALLGGHCIVDSWLGNAEDKEHFADLSVRLRGPDRAQRAGGVQRELGGPDGRAFHGRHGVSASGAGRRHHGPCRLREAGRFGTRRETAAPRDHLVAPKSASGFRTRISFRNPRRSTASAQRLPAASMCGC